MVTHWMVVVQAGVKLGQQVRAAVELRDMPREPDHCDEIQGVTAWHGNVNHTGISTKREPHGDQYETGTTPLAVTVIFFL